MILRVAFTDGSRFVIRLSGTGTEGATLRLYLERYVAGPDGLDLDVQAALAPVIAAAETLAGIKAASGRDVLLVPFDEEQRQALIEEYPFFEGVEVPADTYPGQSDPYAGLDVGSMHLIASADADEDLVYRVTKTIYEKRERVVEKHAAGRAINPNNVVRDTGTEFHPGAIRFYREIGIWPEADPEAPDAEQEAS